jgi:sec-independent protein translocase protein TatB
MGTPPQIELGILGWTDSLLLMVLALVVFGPRRLPQIGRQIGKLMYEFRKASNDFKFQMEEELRASEEADRRKKEEERLKALALQAPAVEPPAPVVSPASPYREDAVYPPSTPPPDTTPTASEEARTTALEETQREQTHPQIQPPSTGEQVPAARPYKAEAEGAAHFGHASDNGSPIKTEGAVNEEAEGGPAIESVPAAAVDTHTVTEQAAQHG